MNNPKPNHMNPLIPCESRTLRSSLRNLAAGILACGSTIGALLPAPGHAQTVSFSFSAPGQTKAMTHWGADTAWPSSDNMRHCISHMGLSQVDVVRLNFFTDELVSGGQLGPNSRAQLDNQLALAATVGPNVPIALTPSTGSGAHAGYLDGNGNFIPSKMIELLKATINYIGPNHPIEALEVYNEPDWWAGQGTPQNMLDILNLIVADPFFNGIELHGPSTLSCDSANWWYDQVHGPLTHGSTHHIGWGSSANYVSFIQNVLSKGDIPYNPEFHSMAEVLYGCEYGMVGGIWWGPALRPRGILVNAVQGKRLGYAENLGASSAAAVYRAPDGEVYGFAGGIEYYGPTTNYRFVCTDQDVYFNGIGPIREFMYPSWLDDQGGYFNIDNTPSLPALDGHRWKIVNRSSGKLLTVAQGSLNDGANVIHWQDVGAPEQLWDIRRDRDGYCTILNAKSGKALELYGWSLSDGGNIDQWTSVDGFNQNWYIDNASNGYFSIRNGHSNLYMNADPGGDNVVQWSSNGGQQQEWQFVLADPVGSGVPVARYEFEGDAGDSAGPNHGATFGSPAYTTGPTGQAIGLDGSDDYVDLPNDVSNSSDITIATWVKWNGGAAWQRIFDFGLNTDKYMFLTPSSNVGMLEFSITDGSYQEEQSIVTDALPVGQWVHVALTLNSNTGILYIDGAPKVAAHMTLDPSDVTGGQQQNNYIGKSQWADPLFNGQIDDFRIYNYALSGSEISDLVLVPTPITPWIQIDYGSWQGGVSDANLTEGQSVVLGPQPVTGGSWSWSGPNGFSSTTREITLANVTVSDSGSYIATYTNDVGAQSQQPFDITVSPVGTASLRVSGITLATVNAGQGKKRGQAQVTIVDHTGAPVSGASVIGTFSGSYNETRSATTNGSGVAVITTSATAKGGVAFSFCIDDVSGSLPYDAGQNVETCDSL